MIELPCSPRIYLGKLIRVTLIQSGSGKSLSGKFFRLMSALLGPNRDPVGMKDNME